MITETFTLPVYWASYLVNDDASGLEDNEQDEIDAWLDANAPGVCVDVSEDYGFCHTNDANNIGGDCAVYTFMKH